LDGSIFVNMPRYDKIVADILCWGGGAGMLRVLLICSGNTCRSPMAETLLADKINQHGLADRIKVLSAGLYVSGENSASAGALAAMARRGLDLTSHRSRQLMPEYVQAADLVLTMTGAHKRMVVATVPEAAKKVYTIAEFAEADSDVLDPFGSSNEIYEKCATDISELLDNAWGKITLLAGKN